MCYLSVAFSANTSSGLTLPTAKTGDSQGSAGVAGYHNMLVDGEAANPGRADLLRLATKADIDRADADRGLEQVRSALSTWPKIAGAFHVPAPQIRDIGKRIDTQVALLGATKVAAMTQKKRPGRSR